LSIFSAESSGERLCTPFKFQKKHLPTPENILQCDADFLLFKNLKNFLESLQDTLSPKKLTKGLLKSKM
jgi:hypothetical protein